MSSSQLTFIFFIGVGIPPTRYRMGPPSYKLVYKPLESPLTSFVISTIKHSLFSHFSKPTERYRLGAPSCINSSILFLVSSLDSPLFLSMSGIERLGCPWLDGIEGRDRWFLGTLKDDENDWLVVWNMTWNMTSPIVGNRKSSNLTNSIIFQRVSGWVGGWSNLTNFIFFRGVEKYTTNQMMLNCDF